MVMRKKRKKRRIINGVVIVCEYIYVYIGVDFKMFENRLAVFRTDLVDFKIHFKVN